jgi:hypothetical protein
VAILEINDFWAGALTTAFGVIIVMIWDYYKIHKDTIDRETNILNAVDYEIKRNINFAILNLSVLAGDVKAREANRETIASLIPFRNEMWTLVKINISKIFLVSGRITDIVTISILNDQINEIIRSREKYRMKVVTGVEEYNIRMQTYNTDLIEKITILRDLLIKLQGKFDKNNIVIRADEAGAYYCIKEAIKNRK